MSAPNQEGTVNAAVLSGGEFGAIVGNATENPVGFYGNEGIAQYSTTGTTTGFTAGGGTTATSASTFTGDVGTKAYTVGDIVRALKQLGVIASS